MLLLLLFRLGRSPSFFVVVAIDDDRVRGTFVVILLRDFEFIESFDDTAVAEAAPAMPPL
jgi:hypothetical protein